MKTTVNQTAESGDGSFRAGFPWKKFRCHFQLRHKTPPDKTFFLGSSFVAACLLLTLFLPSQAQIDPSPPAHPVRLVFVHHSTGGHWLADRNMDNPWGELGKALMNNNYYVSATNYGWGPDDIGSRADIPNWPEWFTGPNSTSIQSALYAESGQNVGEFGAWSRLSTNPGGANEIVMFKSCFPNSDLYGNPDDPPMSEPNDTEFSVANAKAIYNKILTCFAIRQDKLFMLITAPPMAEFEYSSGDQPPTERAANARAFNEWLVNDWLAGYRHANAAVFDYYNVLTSNGGASRVDDPETNEEPNDLGRPDGNHHRFMSGIIQHVTTVNNNFSAYPSGDSHPSTAGQQKATAEFIPLLNIAYNRWKKTTAVGNPHDLLTNHPAFILMENYPNPFNPATTIRFEVSEPCRVMLKVCDIRGHEIAMIANGRYASGSHEVRFNGSGLPSGIYVYRIRMGDYETARKMTILE